MYRALENAFTHFFGEQTEKHEGFKTRHDQLELALGAYQDSNYNRHTEIGNELDTRCARLVGILEEQMAALEAKLDATLQQTNGQAVSMQGEDAQLTTKIEELAKSLAHDISKTASNSEQMITGLKRDVDVALKELDRSVQERYTESVTELKRDVDVTLKELDRSVHERHERHSESINSRTHDASSLFECLKVDFEKKIDDIRNHSVAERGRIVRTMEGERTSVRKAYEELTRRLSMEHDARVRENKQMRADHSVDLAEVRRVHQDSHGQLQSMIDLESRRIEEFLETERAARVLETQQLHEKMMRSMNNLGVR